MYGDKLVAALILVSCVIWGPGADRHAFLILPG
jgi:hypothetical protein